MSDLDPEEQAAHWQRMQDTLTRADETLAETTAWQAELRADGTGFDEWHAERQRQARERERPQQQAQVIGRNWAAEQKWVEQIIYQVNKSAILPGIHKWASRRIEELAGYIAGEVGKDFRSLEARIAKSEEATVDLLMEMERRLTALEERAMLKPRPKPKLVNSDDAA